MKNSPDLLSLLLLHESIQKGGLEVVRNFMYFTPEIIYPFLTECSDLLTEKIGIIRKNYLYFQNLGMQFLKKSDNTPFFRENAILRTIDVDLKYIRTQTAELLHRNILPSQDITKLRKTGQMTIENAFEVLGKISTEMNLDTLHDKIENLKDKEQFRTNLDEQRKNPLFLESDVNQLIQYIKGVYEHYRYVIGLFLGLLDYNPTKPERNIEVCYFNPEMHSFSNLYKYDISWKSNSKNPRQNLPSLKEYLNSKHYTKILAVFEWIFYKSNARLYRIAESHHLLDVKQDCLDQGMCAVYDNDIVKYVKIDHLFILQNDMMTVLKLVEWFVLWQLIRYQIGDLTNQIK